MRNSGGSTVNNGHTAKKHGPDQSQSGVPWRAPASGPGSRSPLRGPDIIDAEFEHVDDQGYPIPSRGPVNPSPDPKVRLNPIEFEEDVAARYHRLDMFAGKSGTLDRRKKFPVFGFVAVFAALCLGGFWFSGGNAMVSKPAVTQSASSPMSQDVDSESKVVFEAVVTQGAVTNQLSGVPQALPIADEAAGHTKEGSLIYVRTPGKRPVGAESKRFRVPVSQPVRSHRDLTISLAGGGGGR